MERNETIFAPNLHSWDLWILAFTILALVSIAALAYNMLKSNSSMSSKSNSPIKTIVGMAMLVSTIVIATIWYSYFKMDKVILSEEGITTPFGYCEYRNIKSNEFLERQNNDSTSSSTFLIIEEYSGTTHILRDSHYDIEAIKNKLDSLINVTQ